MLARIAFSEVVDEKLVETLKQDAVANASSLARPGPEKIYDADIFKFRLQFQIAADSHDNASSSISGSTIDLDTDVEEDNKEDNKELGEVWPGRYVFTLDHPHEVAVGWMGGTSRQADLCLATQSFASKHSASLTSSRIRFNFEPATSIFFIGRLKKRNTAKIYVNGNLLPSTRMTYALNQPRMNVVIDNLAYTFEYTSFADSPEYIAWLRDYIQHLPAVAGPQHEWPTPSEGARTFGQWTGMKPVGQGASRIVFGASNHKFELVAIKVLVKDQHTASRVNQEVEILQRLTDDAVKEAIDVKESRLVRLKEVLSQTRAGRANTGPFDEVVLVLEPYMSLTLASLCSTNK